MVLSFKSNYILYIVTCIFSVGALVFYVFFVNRTDEIVSAYLEADNKLGTDEIFIINLKERKDRHESMEEIVSYLNWNATFFPAINIKKAVNDSAYPAKPSHVREGGFACWLSHMKIYEKIAKSENIEKALILEDDIDVHVKASKITHTAIESLQDKHWDVLFLGHCSTQEENPNNLINEDIGLYKATYPSCTHGYIITKEGALKMLQYRDKPNNIDWQIGDLGVYHVLDIYILAPPIMLQYHAEGDVSSVNPDGKIFDPVSDMYSLNEFSVREKLTLQNP